VATLLDALVSGRIFAVVLAMLLLEAVLLTAFGRRGGKGLETTEWLPALVAGIGLALAGFCTSLHADPRLIGASLLLALGGHVLDLRQRMRRRPH
jgi:hypothetical protein